MVPMGSLAATSSVCRKPKFGYIIEILGAINGAPSGISGVVASQASVVTTDVGTAAIGKTGYTSSRSIRIVDCGLDLGQGVML